MSSSFFSFNGSDLLKYESYQENPADWTTNFPKMDGKNENLFITTDPWEEKTKLTSRSKKSCMNPYESSFQCNFLYEHIEACQIKLQNFMESISQCSKLIQKQTLKSKLLIKKYEHQYQCTQILDSIYCGISTSQKQQFKVDLKYEKKLKEYLDEICHKFVPEVAGQLVSIANFIWNQYLTVIQSNFYEQELRLWAQNLVESKFNNYKKFLEKTKEKCFEDDQNEAFPNFQEAIKSFMKYYFITIALLIEQYFDNPFFKKENEETKSLKRMSSDEDCYSSDQFSELQEDIFGCKKLKF